MRCSAHAKVTALPCLVVGQAHWTSMTPRTAYSTSTPMKPTLFSGHYLRNRSTLDICFGLYRYSLTLGTLSRSLAHSSWDTLYIYIYIYIYIPRTPGHTLEERLPYYFCLGLRNQHQPSCYVNCLTRTNEILLSSRLPN